MLAPQTMAIAANRSTPCAMWSNATRVTIASTAASANHGPVRVARRVIVQKWSRSSAVEARAPGVVEQDAGLPATPGNAHDVGAGGIVGRLGVVAADHEPAV